MSFLSDWQKVRRLAPYERQMAKRAIKSRVLWWFGRVLTIALFAGLAALAATAMAGVKTGLQGGQDAPTQLLDLLFLGAGTFILYLQLMVLFNRLCVLPFDELLASPLSGRALLMERIAAQVKVLPLYALLAVPFVVAYGIVEQAGPGYYPLAVLATFLVTLALFVTALLILVLVLLVLKRRMSREGLALFSSLVTAAVFVVPRFATASTVYAHMQGSLQTEAWSWAPMMWAPRMIVAAARGSVGGVVVYGLVLVAWTLLGSTLAFAFANRSLHDRIGRLTDSQIRSRKRRSLLAASQGSFVTRPGRQTLFPAAVRAVLYKDWLRLRRTPSEWIGLLFSSVYFWFILLQPDGSGLTGAVRLAVMMAVMILPTARFGVGSLGIERAQVTLLLQAPLEPRALLLAKWVYAFVPALLWSQVSLLVFALIVRAPVGAVAVAGVCTVAAVAGTTMITLPFAVHHAAFVVTARQGRQRNVYTKPGAGFAVLAQLPLYALQGVAVVYGTAPYWPQTQSWIATLFTPSVAVHAAVAIALSLLSSALACAIGWTIAIEGWRARLVLIRQSGALD